MPQRTIRSASVGMCAGSVDAAQRADRAAADRRRTHAVVVEHRHAVGGEPHVTLQPVGPEAQGQLERLQRVLRGVGARPAVAERDRVVEERREPLLHRPMMPRCAVVRSGGSVSS